MKYIIKNCPCLYILRDMDLICKDTPNEQKECHLIPDCLLKRIVELSKECKCLNNCKYEDTKQCNSSCFWFGQSGTLKGILNLLEIEEVDEEK